jgi:hypothetical protein
MIIDYFCSVYFSLENLCLSSLCFISFGVLCFLLKEIYDCCFTPQTLKKENENEKKDKKEELYENKYLASYERLSEDMYLSGEQKEELKLLTIQLELDYNKKYKDVLNEIYETNKEILEIFFSEDKESPENKYRKNELLTIKKYKENILKLCEQKVSDVNCFYKEAKDIIENKNINVNNFVMEMTPFGNIIMYY